MKNNRKLMRRTDDGGDMVYCALNHHHAYFTEYYNLLYKDNVYDDRNESIMIHSNARAGLSNLQ